MWVRLKKILLIAFQGAHQAPSVAGTFRACSFRVFCRSCKACNAAFASLFPFSAALLYHFTAEKGNKDAKAALQALQDRQKTRKEQARKVPATDGA